MADELPPPDLIDSAGRMRRLVLAFVVGAVVAAIAWTISNQLAEPDKQATTGGYKFVAYMTAFFGIAAFLTTLAIANRLAKRAWERERIPPAKQR